MRFVTTLLILTMVRSSIASTQQPPSRDLQFWVPTLTSSKPLLICLPKPILYRPSAELYKRSAKTHGEFDREVDRMTNRPHLQPGDMIPWGNMVEYYDFGVGQGDVQAAVRLSNFLAHQGKESELRFCSGYSYADLRTSPAVVIGAFSNPLAIEMTSGLHFSFVDDEKGFGFRNKVLPGTPGPQSMVRPARIMAWQLVFWIPTLGSLSFWSRELRVRFRCGNRSDRESEWLGESPSRSSQGLGPKERSDSCQYTS